MTAKEWTAEVCRRIGINEGRRRYMYHDSVGIPTIGVGFNLQRGDAHSALAKVGVRDVAGVMAGHVPLTEPQIDALFAYSFAPILSEARASLGFTPFDHMSDARRFVICDLVFNLGDTGWAGFAGTRSLLIRAQTNKDHGKLDVAHSLFEQAAQHLEASAWYGQVGDRARRDVAMIRTGTWVDAYGDGTR